MRYASQSNSNIKNFDIVVQDRRWISSTKIKTEVYSKKMRGSNKQGRDFFVCIGKKIFFFATPFTNPSKYRRTCVFNNNV